MSQYGIPYMGSKSKIAEKICAIFPKADHFYDLFGGGFSITHCMLKTRASDFKYFHFNEIRNGMTELIKDAISGKFNYDNYKMPWVDREDFFANKETDLFKKIIWSFGNGGKDYLFGKEIEHQKKSLHNAIIFNEFDDYAKWFFGFDKFKEGYSVTDKRLFVKNRLKKLSLNRCDLEPLERLERLQQLQQFEQLERLQQFERLERLSFYNLSYEKIEIKKNAVVYCDIPYEGTAEYDGFDHNQFYAWVKEQSFPIFISEYNIDKPFLKLIFANKKRSTLQGGSSVKKVEKVYCNDVALKILRSQ